MILAGRETPPWEEGWVKRCVRSAGHGPLHPNWRKTRLIRAGETGRTLLSLDSVVVAVMAMATVMAVTVNAVLVNIGAAIAAATTEKDVGDAGEDVEHEKAAAAA